MILDCKSVDKLSMGLGAFKADIFHCLVQVDASDSIAAVLKEITDTSWISKLSPICQVGYGNRLKKTAEKIVANCNTVLAGHKTGVFDYQTIGEYIVSREGRCALGQGFSHNILPLAELWKERVSNNGGFDFHTESPSEILIFGEAKYNSNCNPYNDAIKQVEGFIADGKDANEIIDLANIASDQKFLNSFLVNKKGYAVAFSIDADEPLTIVKNALQSGEIVNLANYSEFYIIGVIINDK